MKPGHLIPFLAAAALFLGNPADAATPQDNRRSATPFSSMDRDGDGRIGEETAIKERIRAYIERHGHDGQLSAGQMLDRALFSYSRWLSEERHLGHKGLHDAGFVNIGPINGAGRTSAVAPHPTIDGLILQGAASGGVWKTLDGGQTWYPTTDGLSDLSVGAIAWAPGSPDVVYVGTGEGDTMLAGGTGYIPGIGMLRSDDGGETWTIPGGNGYPVADLFFSLDVDPDNDEIVFAATNEGLLRTEDGGVSWEVSIPANYAVTDVVRSRSNPDLLYACLWCEGSCPSGTGRVMRSEDRGLTWNPVGGEGLPLLHGYTNRAAFAVAPSNDQILYFATNTDRGTNGTPTSAIFRSDDGGETWTETAVSSTNRVKEYLGYQGWYDTTIVVNPTDPDIVVAGGVWYVLTSDGGETWTNRNPYDSGSGMGTATLPHVDVHDLQYQGDVLWVGCDGGVWFSENDGRTWTGRNDGVVTRQYYGMDIDPINRERVLGGTQDNGTNLRRDAGDDRFDLVLGGDGFECAINPLMPEIMYATIYNTAVYRTNPQTGRFSNISPPYGDEDAPFITPLTLDATNPSIVYTGAESLWRSDNGGDAWYGLPLDPSNDVSGFPWLPGEIWAIATTPADPEMIAFSKGSFIYVSRDSGRTWYGSVINERAFNIDISPHDPNVLLTAMEASTQDRGIYRSTDGGMNWTPSGSGLPPFNTQVVRFDPTDPDVAYAGTDVGLYRSTDGGVTWSHWGTGLPAASIHDLRILPDGSMMRIASYGRGFWELALDQPQNTTPEIEITEPSSSTISLNVGEPLHLEATATDDDHDALSVEWYLTTDYEVFHSETGSSVIDSSVDRTVMAGGFYQVAARVSDTKGGQDVDFITIMAIDPADDCAHPWIIPGGGPFPATIATSNVFASTGTTDPYLSCVDPDTSDPNSGREASLWFEFTPEVSATYSISTCGSGADTLLSAWTGDACGSYIEVAGGCNDDDENDHCFGPRTDSYLELDLDAGTTYRFMVGSWRSLQGSVYQGMVHFTVDCLSCVEEPAETLIVPAAAHADGLNGTVWLTDLDLFNPGETAVTANLAFLPADSDNSGVEEFTAEIPPGRAVSFPDVVGDFLQTAGSGAIRITADGLFLASSRTYNTAEDGTFGQFIPGFSENDALDPGDDIRLNGLAGNDSFRTNIGFANASGRPASVAIDLIGSDGSVIGHLDRELQPWGWLQVNKVFQTAGTGAVDAASAVVRNSSESASVFVYASVVDASTGDPTFVTGTAPGSDTAPLWIAASAHADGVGDSVWRTDVWLTNTTATPAEATLHLLKRDLDNTSAETFDVRLPAGENVLLNDALDTAFGFTGTAALRVSFDGSASVTSRTYNLASRGTFGQFIPGVNEDTAVSDGLTAILIQLQSTEEFRTNIGFVNLGPSPVTVHAEFFSGDGTLLRTKDYFFKPYQYFQDGSALPTETDVRGGFALLTTSTTGGRFLAYASVVDNGSDDPIFMPAQILPE